MVSILIGTIIFYNWEMKQKLEKVETADEHELSAINNIAYYIQRTKSSLREVLVEILHEALDNRIKTADHEHADHEHTEHSNKDPHQKNNRHDKHDAYDSHHDPHQEIEHALSIVKNSIVSIQNNLVSWEKAINTGINLVTDPEEIKFEKEKLEQLDNIKEDISRFIFKTNKFVNNTQNQLKKQINESKPTKYTHNFIELSKMFDHEIEPISREIQKFAKDMQVNISHEMERHLKEIEQESDEIIMISSILALCAVAMVLLFAFIILRRVSGPLEVLNRATLEITKGNFDKKIDVLIEDEVGELASSFNTMTDHLKTAQNELHQQNDELKTEIEERQNLEKLKERESSLKTVQNALLQITFSKQSLKEKLNNSLRKILSISEFFINKPQGAIFLYNEKSQMLELTAHNRLHPSLVQSCNRVAQGHCQCGKTATTRKIEFTSRINEHSDSDYDNTQPCDRYSFPILSGEKLLGVFTVYLQDNHLDSVEYENLFKSLTNTLAILIERDRAELRLQEQSWIETSAVKFGEIVQKSDKLQTFAQNLISKLTPFLRGEHGVMYILNEETKRYQLLGSYGYTERKNVSNSFAPGESLIGQCVLENNTIRLTNVPDDYIKISSGLGEASPQEILTIPIGFQGKVLAVIEIASFKRFTHLQETLLEKLTPIIGLGLENLMRSIRTEELLQETQNQAEKLQAQGEDLRRTNIAMEKKTQELEISENKLKEGQEQLMESNRQLEQQAAKLEESFRRTEEQARELEATNKYKTEFLANMSHELRTPLNSLLILAKNLYTNDEGNLSKEQSKDAQIIHESGIDLLNLINDLLDLAKIEARKVDLDVESLDVNSLVISLEQQFKRIAKENKIKWVVDIAKDLNKKIHTDARKVEQIIRNFLSNAIKFTKKGSVTLQINQPTKTNHSLAISVIDTGIGIPAEKQNQVFEAFQQADGSTSREYGGTGLGLSISRELARLLKAEIKLESTENKGSIFTLLLPKKIKQSTVPEIMEEVRELESQKRQITPTLSTNQPITTDQTISDDRENLTANDRIILIIEDDVKFVRLVARISRAKGYKCLIATDGESGLELAQTYKPSGIILDLSLPKMDGWAILKYLKNNADTRHIPVHIVSVFDQVNEGLKKGAVGYLVKPVDQEKLEKAFKKIAHFSSQTIRNLLIAVKDDKEKQDIVELVNNKQVKITTVYEGQKVTELLKEQTFDCLVLDLNLPDIKSLDLLHQISKDKDIVAPPTVIYSDRKLSTKEREKLSKYTHDIVVKDVHTNERLLDEMSLFLHSVEQNLPSNHTNITDSITTQIRERKIDLKNIDKTVLVVDDDMRNAYALCRSLERKGINTVIAPDGREALHLIDQNPEVNAVLMDIMMPIMDGYETIKEIRKQDRFKKLPIITLTAQARSKDKEKSLKVGANDYLAKPVDVEKLFKVLEKWF